MRGDRTDCLLRIALALGLSQSKIRKLLLYVKDPLVLFEKDNYGSLLVEAQVMAAVAGVRDEEARKLRTLVERNGIDIVTIVDDDYPPLLRLIDDPPGILFLRGKRRLITKASVCLVGSRMATPEGTSIAHEIAGDLASEGLLVVSGLARGIDRAAHRGALDAAGDTAAVLGCGVDVCYPRSCRREYEEISTDGVILSELLPGAEPRRPFFPRRNRIMSGMSMGIVVVEAAARSGALITAGFALDEGREVFAVPGSPRNPLSRGTNGLIKQGAVPVEQVSDIMETLRVSGLLNRDVPKTRDGGDDILKFLGGGPRSVDELSALTGRTASGLLQNLVEMELVGQITRMPGMRFRLSL